MIDIQGVTKSFGNLQVLKSIDLYIDRGKVVSIVGPNGTGKTMLLQIIGTLDQPDDGQIKVNDILLNGLSSDKLSDFCDRHIGFVFQSYQLLSELTALEDVLILAYIAGKGQGEVRKRAQELLGSMGLTDRAHHKLNQLSDGEKRRVVVAHVLVNHPAMILVDGPSGSLDSKNKAELHQLFFNLRDKFGQIFATVAHDEGLATLTDRTIHMKDGRLTEPQITDIESAESKE